MDLFEIRQDLPLFQLRNLCIKLNSKRVRNFGAFSCRADFEEFTQGIEESSQLLRLCLNQAYNLLSAENLSQLTPVFKTCFDIYTSQIATFIANFHFLEDGLPALSGDPALRRLPGGVRLFSTPTADPQQTVPVYEIKVADELIRRIHPRRLEDVPAFTEEDKTEIFIEKIVRDLDNNIPVNFKNIRSPTLAVRLSQRLVREYELFMQKSAEIVDKVSNKLAGTAMAKTNFDSTLEILRGIVQGNSQSSGPPCHLPTPIDPSELGSFTSLEARFRERLEEGAWTIYRMLRVRLHLDERLATESQAIQTDFDLASEADLIKKHQENLDLLKKTLAMKHEDLLQRESEISVLKQRYFSIRASIGQPADAQDLEESMDGDVAQAVEDLKAECKKEAAKASYYEAETDKAKRAMDAAAEKVAELSEILKQSMADEEEGKKEKGSGSRWALLAEDFTVDKLEEKLKTALARLEDLVEKKIDSDFGKPGEDRASGRKRLGRRVAPAAPRLQSSTTAPQKKGAMSKTQPLGDEFKKLSSRGQSMARPAATGPLIRVPVEKPKPTKALISSQPSKKSRPIESTDTKPPAVPLAGPRPQPPEPKVQPKPPENVKKNEISEPQHPEDPSESPGHSVVEAIREPESVGSLPNEKQFSGDPKKSIATPISPFPKKVALVKLKKPLPAAFNPIEPQLASAPANTLAEPDPSHSRISFAKSPTITKDLHLVTVKETRNFNEPSEANEHQAPRFSQRNSEMGSPTIGNSSIFSSALRPEPFVPAKPSQLEEPAFIAKRTSSINREIMYSHLRNQQKERLAIQECYSYHQKKGTHSSQPSSLGPSLKPDPVTLQNILKKHTTSEAPSARVSKAFMAFDPPVLSEPGLPITRKMTRLRSIFPKHKAEDRHFQPNLDEIFLESKGLIDFSKFRSKTFWGKAENRGTDLPPNASKPDLPHGDPAHESPPNFLRGLTERFNLASGGSYDRILNIRSVFSPATTTENFRPARGKDWRKNYVIMARHRRQGGSSSDRQLEVSGTGAPPARV